MPIMKQHAAASALREAVVLDLGDVGRQAERIMAAARQRAERTLAEAERRAQAASAELRERALAEGHAQGLERGLEEGRTQGRAEALGAMREQLEMVATAWSDVAGQWDAQRRDMEREARQAVIEFALSLGEKLVHRVIEVDPTVIVDQVAAALSYVLRPLDVSVRLNPADRPILEEALPQLLAEFAHLQHVHLVEDGQISPGGCVVSFGQGRIDATIEKQLHRVIDTILPDDGGGPGDAEDGGAGGPEPDPADGPGPSEEARADRAQEPEGSAPDADAAPRRRGRPEPR